MAIDYKSFSPDGPQNGPNQSQKRWWLLKGKERAQACEAVLGLIYENDSRRQTGYQTNARLYGNVTLMGVTGYSFTRGTQNVTASKDRITYNVVQAAIDTITSKIGKNKPKPMFLTSGGDYKLQAKAKKLQKFTDGLFYENKIYDLGSDIFRDGGVFGDGIIHVYEHEGRIKYERVMASELYVDYAEARYGLPRQLHRVKAIDRDVLIEMFPGKEKVIKAANAAQFDPSNKLNVVADQVNVCESYHLRSSEKATDGVHSIWIEGEELFSEEWEFDYFPYAFFKWCKRQDGFWAQGAAEQVAGLQLEINKLMWVIQRSYHLGGSFKVLLENGSKIVKEHLNNDVGSVITYTGSPPSYITPPMIAMEAYAWLDKLVQRAFEQVGVSMLSASAKKPEGLDSGKALREFNDIESDRFMTLGQRYEQLFLDVSQISIDLARKIYQREGSYEVRVPGRKFIETIDWKDVDMDNDSFILQAFPVSSFANTPMGRLQDVKELTQAGMISPRTGKKLMDFPDLEQVENLQNAPDEYLNQILEKMLYDGEYTAPEPLDDLALASELALEFYAQGKMSMAEPEKLEMVRTFIDQVNMLKEKAMPPPMPAPGGAGGPQAVPAPPPVSGLMPNAPGAA